MTIDEQVNEVERQIAQHEITKEQVFVKMKYFVQKLQKAEHNIEYKQSCDNCFYKPVSRDHS